MLVLQAPRKPEHDVTDRRGTDRVPRVSRVIGVDVARGTALLGMMAVHVFDITDDQGAPTPTVIAGGLRSSRMGPGRRAHRCIR
jgi:hypothetical protein